MEQLLSAAEVAQRLGMDRRHVANLAKRGKIPAQLIGRSYVFRPEDIERYQPHTGGWPRGKRRTPAPTHDEHTARLQALLAAHPELTEIKMDPGYACGQPRIADTRIPADMAATCYREFAYDLARTQESYDITREQAEQALAWEQIVKEAGDELVVHSGRTGTAGTR